MVVVAIGPATTNAGGQDWPRVGGAGQDTPTSGSKDTYWSPLFGIGSPWKTDKKISILI